LMWAAAGLSPLVKAHSCMQGWQGATWQAESPESCRAQCTSKVVPPVVPVKPAPVSSGCEWDSQTKSCGLTAGCDLTAFKSSTTLMWAAAGLSPLVKAHSCMQGWQGATWQAESPESCRAQCTGKTMVAPVTGVPLASSDAVEVLCKRQWLACISSGTTVDICSRTRLDCLSGDTAGTAGGDTTEGNDTAEGDGAAKGEDAAMKPDTSDAAMSTLTMSNPVTAVRSQALLKRLFAESHRRSQLASAHRRTQQARPASQPKKQTQKSRSNFTNGSWQVR